MSRPAVAAHADFGASAHLYEKRAPYAQRVFSCLQQYVGAAPGVTQVADIGAGTGNFTRLLAAAGLHGQAVEPDARMRAEAARLLGNHAFTWIDGTAEQTGLPSSSIDWLCVSTSFHLMDAPCALQEFARVLRPAGHLTIVWKLREIGDDPLMNRIEMLIASMAPGLDRLYEQALDTIACLEDSVKANGCFADCLHIDAPHEEVLSRDDYVAIWRSAEEIQSQVGPVRWRDILAAIDDLVPRQSHITALHRTHAWTFRRAGEGTRS